MIFFILTFIVIIILLIISFKDETLCPKCGGELVDQGFEGWKLGCVSCSWNNHNNRSL